MSNVNFKIDRKDIYILMYALRRVELEEDLPDDLTARAHELFLHFHLMDMLAPFGMSVSEDEDE